MKKCFVVFGAALALCITVPFVALADKENPNPYLAIVMKGNDPTVNIDMTEDKSGEGWSFDASSHTLILDGLDAQNIQLFNAEYPVTVEIAGDSSLDMGIFFKTKGGVTVCGDGTLAIGGNFTGTTWIDDTVTIESGTIVSENRFYLNGGKLHIEGGSVSIDTSGNMPYALIGATYDYDDALAISDGALTLRGDKEALHLDHSTGDPYDSYGIHEGVAFTGEDGEALYLKVEQKIMPTYESYMSTISDEDGTPAAYAELTASDDTTEPIVILDPSAEKPEQPEQPEQPGTEPEKPPVTDPDEEEPPVASDSDAEEPPVASDSDADDSIASDSNASSSGSSGGGASGSSLSAQMRADSLNAVYSADLIFGGEWRLDENGWWFVGNDGSYPKNVWAELTWNGQTGWYYFNAQGYMQTGWLQLGNSWYFLHDIADGMQGLMYTGWHEIDGKWYYFNEIPSGPVPLGMMFANSMTPDGYRVDRNGVWIP